MQQVWKLNRWERAMVALLLLSLVLTPVAGARTASRARSEIVAMYDKVALAFTLKYVEGIMSVRNVGYKGYDVDGEKLDLSTEPARYQLMFEDSLSVNMDTEVQDFELTSDDDHARCTVRQVITFVKSDPMRNKRYTVLLESNSRDEWVYTSDGWRIHSSRVLWQAYRRRRS